MQDRELSVRRDAPPIDRAWAAAWQRAARLAHGCDRVSHRLPCAERPSLGAQLRSAGRAVPARVAVGQGCAPPGERAYHLAVARGALGEVEAVLRLARRLGYLPNGEGERLLGRCAEVRTLLGRLVAATWLGA